MDANLDKYLKALSSKSCATDVDLSLLNHPNLEADRLTQDFIQRLVDLSTLLGDVTTMTRSECKGEIPRFDACHTPVVGACAQPCLPNFQIEHDYLTYDMVKYVVAHSYDQDMLDCNKFGDRIKDISMDMLMTSMKNKMELAAIMGDEDLPTGADYSADNNLLGVNDGWLKLACSCTPGAQIIDAQGAGPSRELFMAARKLLPPRYRGQRHNYHFIGGPSLHDWHAQDTSYRPTAAGDRAVETGSGGRIWGNSFYEASQWPEYLPYTIGGVEKEVTHVMFTPLTNLVHMMQRKLDFKTEYDYTCDRYLTVGFFRQDFMIADPDAVILLKNVDVCGDPWDGCVKPVQDDCALNHNACPCPDPNPPE